MDRMQDEILNLSGCIACTNFNLYLLVGWLATTRAKVRQIQGPISVNRQQRILRRNHINHRIALP